MPPIVFLQTKKLTRIMITVSPQNCHQRLQSHSFWLKYAPNRSAAGASLQTSVGSSQRSPAGKWERKGIRRMGREGRGLPPLKFRSGYALVQTLKIERR